MRMAASDRAQRTGLAVETPRVLFVTVGYPRDEGSGGLIVSWRALEAYARFARVDTVALVPPRAEEPEGLREITAGIEAIPIKGFHSVSRGRAIARLARSVFQRRPARMMGFNARRPRHLIANLSSTNNYDILHCDHLWTAPFAPFVSAQKKVLLEHNVEWELIARLAEHSNGRSAVRLRHEAKRTRQYETSLTSGFDHILTLSEADRESLLLETPGLASRLSVWPVPVRINRPVRPTPNGPFTVLMLGSLRSTGGGRLHGLLWFLREVWPELRRAVPDARLEVVGADPPAGLLEADGRNGVSIRGFVTDIDQLLGSATVSAIPLFVGAGIRIKVLELLSEGIPCIGTDLALRGYDQVPGTALADTKQEWIDLLKGVAADPHALRRQAHEGAAMLRAERSVERAADHLRELWHAGDPVTEMAPIRSSIT